MSFRDQVRHLRVLTLVFHVVAGGVWIAFMAGGFPFWHPRFFANRGIPAVVIGVGVVGLYFARKEQIPRLQSVLLALAAGWGFAALAGIVLFPFSGRLPLVIGVLAAWAILILALEGANRENLRSPGTIALAILGAVMGAFVPFTQRAAEPATVPFRRAMDLAPAEPAASAPLEAVLSRHLRVSPADGTVSCIHDRVMITVQPMLTFLSRSPDRCWTILARRAQQRAPMRALTHWNRHESGLKLRYADLGITDLAVSAEGMEGARIEAASELPGAVYSHLNTFCEISVIGHSKLSVKFSPCSASAIEVLPMDYPVGRPARFAFLGAPGVFRVVQASSGEKGPFHDLAAGKMERTQSLEMILLDDGRAFASIILTDWAAQVSTDLSPTAGWRVPQNSIEFSLQDDSPRSGANFFISLASTSVGRGYDSVGHAPGIYRNRMMVKFLPP